MTYTLEISDDLKERLDGHLEEDESHEEFIEELVSMYETEGVSPGRLFGMTRLGAVPAGPRPSVG